MLVAFSSGSTMAEMMARDGLNSCDPRGRPLLDRLVREDEKFTSLPGCHAGLSHAFPVHLFNWPLRTKCHKE